MNVPRGLATDLANHPPPSRSYCRTAVDNVAKSPVCRGEFAEADDVDFKIKSSGLGSCAWHVAQQSQFGHPPVSGVAIRISEMMLGSGRRAES